MGAALEKDYGGGHRNRGGRGRGGGLWRRVLSRLPRKRRMMEAHIWIESFCLQVVSWTLRNSVCFHTVYQRPACFLRRMSVRFFHEDLLLSTRRIFWIWAGRMAGRVLSLRLN